MIVKIDVNGVNLAISRQIKAEENYITSLKNYYYVIIKSGNSRCMILKEKNQYLLILKKYMDFNLANSNTSTNSFNL